MAASKSTIYVDTLFCPALIQKLNEATSTIEVIMFLVKTSYVGRTRVDDVIEALIAAAQRGMRVMVILNYAYYEPDVMLENWHAAERLAAGGCEVALGPPNQTLHTKMFLIDLRHVFIGSHNVTRGGLSSNAEMTMYSHTIHNAAIAADYFNTKWRHVTPLAQGTPPAADIQPVKITLLRTTTVGDAVRIEFDVNHSLGVDAFAAVADDELSLAGATIGDTVATTERAAEITPIQAAGSTVSFAVRAYREGVVEATSNIFSMVYQPTEENGGEGEPGNGGTEPPPPEPLIAPHLDSVVAGLGGTEITAAWTFAGCANFLRFEIQKRDVDLNWQAVGTTYNGEAREWVGPGPGTTEPTTYRVVVFNMAEESAASNEITITGETPVPLQAPVLVSVYQIGPMGIDVEWSHVTPTEFTRYEVQQSMIGSWSAIGTITTPETRSWSGGPIPYMDPTHPVRVVVFVQSGDSAGSNEMAITPM